MSTILFEECEFCGLDFMRKQAQLYYNQTQDVFYKVWRCLNCDGFYYEEVEPKDLENAECWKKVCLALQRYNRKTSEYNKKFGLLK